MTVLIGNKNISTTVDATVTLYEATNDDLTTVVKNLLVVPVARSTSLLINPILLQVTEGHALMGVTTDDDVLVTILGYYL